MDGIKPRALAPKPETIPAELKSYRAWVLWRYELVKEKWTKIPYQIDGKRRAQTDDPSTWGSFESAIRNCPHGGGGIGFVLSKEQGLSAWTWTIASMG